jgi:hypothetical protein
LVEHSLENGKRTRNPACRHTDAQALGVGLSSASGFRASPASSKASDGRPRRLPCGLILFALFDPVRPLGDRRPHLTALRSGTGSGEGKAAPPPISRPGVPDRTASVGGSLPFSHSRKLVIDWLRHRLRSGGHGIRRLCAVFRDLAVPSPPVRWHYMISGTEIGLATPSVR